MFEFHIDRIIASTNSFTTMISAHEDLNDGGNLPHYVFFSLLCDFASYCIIKLRETQWPVSAVQADSISLGYILGFFKEAPR